VLDILLYAFAVYIAANYTVMLVSSIMYKPRLTDAGTPKVSAIIPAKDEETVIERTLKNLRKSYNNLEIIIVDGSKSSATAQIGKKYHARIIEDRAGKGKAAALNLAVNKAKGEFLYFIDADCVVSKSTIKSLLSSVGDSDASVGVVIAEGRTAMSMLGRLETLFLNATNYWVSAVLGTAFVVGRNYLIKRSVLLGVGKFDDVLSEDINLSYKLYKAKKKVVFNPSALCVEESPKKLSHFFKQQERWGSGSFHEINKSLRTNPILSATLFFIALFYIFTPAFLLLSILIPVFIIPGIAGLSAIFLLSARHLRKTEIIAVLPALTLAMIIFICVFISILVKRALGRRISWYKTPR